jgi:hypothetical protein
MMHWLISPPLPRDRAVYVDPATLGRAAAGRAWSSSTATEFIFRSSMSGTGREPIEAVQPDPRLTGKLEESARCGKGAAARTGGRGRCLPPFVEWSFAH